MLFYSDHRGLSWHHGSMSRKSGQRITWQIINVKMDDEDVAYECQDGACDGAWLTNLLGSVVCRAQQSSIITVVIHHNI